MSWTPEKVDKLKQLWGKGNNGVKLHPHWRINRNAVKIGKDPDLKSYCKNLLKKNITLIKFHSIKKMLHNWKENTQNRFKSLLLDKSFEPENPKSLEELHDEICRWPIGHPNEPDFYFCGRKSMKDFSYCKLHVLYAFQPKNKKEDLMEKDDEVPRFIKKKIKSA
jgi:GcrA cell cycle regulator